MRERLIVVGNGMVGHHFLCRTFGNDRFDVVAFCEEPRLAYDRVGMSGFFDGKTAADLALADPAAYAAAGVEVRIGERVVAIDRGGRTVRSSSGEDVPYDVLVLATGSYPFVPPIKGHDAPGCFVYRTIEDLEAIGAASRNAGVGVVLGGGLLGLEAANALKNLGLETHVVEMGGRLLGLQVDDPGGAVLRGRIEALGVAVHTGMQTKEVMVEDGRAKGLRFADGGELPAELVVFSAGIRARDELARPAGLTMGARGGFAVDERCRTSDPAIWAIGECASFDGRTFGLVGPGYRMAEVAWESIAGDGAEVFRGADLSTKLKLLGVEVGSFGDAFGFEPGSRSISYLDTVAGFYKKLVLSADRQRLLGGMLVGDAASYSQLLALVQNRVTLTGKPEALILPRSEGDSAGFGIEALPADATICSCHNVSKETICQAIDGGKLSAVGAIKSCTKAGTGCGSCVPLLGDLLKSELRRAGVEVKNHLCEHFPHSRQELFHLARVKQHRRFEDILAAHGKGRGCEVCRPAVASILASLWNEPVNQGERLGLQDTNDRFLANIQRDGTYSVVPRVAGGEITADQLIAIGTVAKKFGLYTKITGGQRIDLFGARLDELPHIWRDLVAAGFESGHAYGKALRTVKSCVGTTWCRFGVQDSVSFAVRLENRYKGLRSPHKLKSAVSGCARECAEAQGKDFGLIATDKGYNVYVCGNGGMKPQHAKLLASDLDEDTAIRYLDRFLMFYIRTADRLERTAPWLNKLEGGIDYLRRVIVEDVLGIGEELEAEMKRVIDSYRCEWKATLEDPARLAQFRTFVNSDAPDPTIVKVPLRTQHRAGTWPEVAARAPQP
jgi:nitrite reductase (NADH) large subunit